MRKTPDEYPNVISALLETHDFELIIVGLGIPRFRPVVRSISSHLPRPGCAVLPVDPRMLYISSVALGYAKIDTTNSDYLFLERVFLK